MTSRRVGARLMSRSRRHMIVWASEASVMTDAGPGLWKPKCSTIPSTCRYMSSTKISAENMYSNIVASIWREPQQSKVIGYVIEEWLDRGAALQRRVVLCFQVRHQPYPFSQGYLNAVLWDLVVVLPGKSSVVSDPRVNRAPPR